MTVLDFRLHFQWVYLEDLLVALGGTKLAAVANDIGEVLLRRLYTLWHPGQPRPPSSLEMHSFVDVGHPALLEGGVGRQGFLQLLCRGPLALLLHHNGEFLVLQPPVKVRQAPPTPRAATDLLLHAPQLTLLDLVSGLLGQPLFTNPIKLFALGNEFCS